MNEKKDSLCVNCETFLNKIISDKRLKSNEIKILKEPQRVINVNFPLRKDDESIEIMSGFRVQYNDARGPFKGGIRFHPDIDLEEMKMLGFLMALKCALMGLPFGGGKGGIVVDPEKLSKNELEQMTRKFIRELAPFIGPQVDVLAPDVNTSPEVMGWVYDEYSKIKGEDVKAVTTGKPLSTGGSKVRAYSTSLGGAIVLREILAMKKMNLRKTAIAIQGFGNVGSNMARTLNEWGAKIVAVSDVSGGRFDPKGLNIKKLLEEKNQGRQLKESKEGKPISNKELLELKVDVLIPAALEDQITIENADKIKARIVIEMANAPITMKADEVLNKRNVLVVPDILANSGGVIVSYFEWAQNLSGEQWSEPQIKKMVEEKMKKALSELFKTCEIEKCTPRYSAYLIAVNRILEAEIDRGRLERKEK